jgi:hypothetical protein
MKLSDAGWATDGGPAHVECMKLSGAGCATDGGPAHVDRMRPPALEKRTALSFADSKRIKNTFAEGCLLNSRSGM